MDLILPTNQNTSAPVTLDTKVLVVIGANGAGKSSFGRNLHQRYAGQSVWISGMHSLFLSSEENKAPVNGNELTRLQSMIAERLFIPRMSEYEKLILHLQTEEFEAAVQYKEESKLTPDLLPPVTMHLPAVLSPSSGIQRIVAFVSFFTCSSVSGVPSQ